MTSGRRPGKMPFKPGDVIVANVQFVDSAEIKRRPAFVLFEELGSVVAAGVTSNVGMKGIPLSRDEGMIKDSVIKLNYIFTVSEDLIISRLFSATQGKRRLVFEELNKRMAGLRE